MARAQDFTPFPDAADALALGSVSRRLYAQAAIPDGAQLPTDRARGLMIRVLRREVAMTMTCPGVGGEMAR